MLPAGSSRVHLFLAWQNIFMLCQCPRALFEMSHLTCKSVMSHVNENMDIRDYDGLNAIANTHTHQCARTHMY